MGKYLRLMRFHKPIGIWLLLWPTLWALWIAGQGRPSIKHIVIFILGTVVMRAAGCVINDIADCNFDKYVARTKDRPLTSGEINLKEALMLFFTLLFLAFILITQLNLLCFKLALVSLFLACLYPFTKRWIYWPQFFLGLAYAMGTPMAFAAELNYLPPITGLMFSIVVLWALMYDTQYAMVDKPDDIKIGIKSTAILFGKHCHVILGILQLIIAVLISYLNIISGILALGFFVYQQYLMRHQKYFQAFLNNQWVGVAVFIPLFFAYGHYFR